MATATSKKREKQGSERRFFERLPQNSVLRVLDPKKPQTDQFAILKDISRGGARLEVGHTFPVGAVISLYLPKTKFGAPQTKKGKVIWSNLATDSPGWFQLGCRFAK